MAILQSINWTYIFLALIIAILFYDLMKLINAYIRKKTAEKYHKEVEARAAELEKKLEESRKELVELLEKQKEDIKKIEGKK